MVGVRRRSPRSVVLTVCAVVVAACAQTGGSTTTTDTTSTTTGAGGEPVGEPGTAVIHEKGWSTPIRLGFNDDGWEDSPYLTRDGSTLLFFYHPWPDLVTTEAELTELILADPEAAVSQGLDGALYVSRRPFATRELHPVSADGSPAVECCPYLSSDGRLFYVSNRRAWEEMADLPEGVYLDGRLLDIGGEPPSNPHWDEVHDELWFDCPGDTDVCVMRQAAAQGFSGPVEKAPYPVNARDPATVQDSQVFLTDDGNTMYLTSSRDHPDLGITRIYRLRRLDEDGYEWSEPELFISADTPVAELSMTADGTELAFAQIFWRDDGSPGIDIYWAQRR